MTTDTANEAIYRSYIDCLNERALDELDEFVAGDVVHNAKALGLRGYRTMLERDIEAIADLRFEIEHLICEAPLVAARLKFDCHPDGEFLGLHVDGRRIRFAENVHYKFAGSKIVEVWSVIDKPAIEAQLRDD